MSATADARRLIAAFFESVDEGLRLLKTEPDLISARTGLGETPLHYLAVENQLDAVRALAERAGEINTLNKCGGGLFPRLHRLATSSS